MGNYLGWVSPLVIAEFPRHLHDQSLALVTTCKMRLVDITFSSCWSRHTRSSRCARVFRAVDPESVNSFFSTGGPVQQCRSRFAFGSSVRSNRVSCIWGVHFLRRGERDSGVKHFMVPMHG